MDRRQALEKVGYLLGGTILGASTLLSPGFTFTSEAENDLFDQGKIDLMNDIGETILPKTNTPGAKEANVGAFMAIYVKDCYTPENQQIFLEGLAKIDQQSKTSYGKGFLEVRPEQRTDLLNRILKESQTYAAQKKAGEPAHYFSMLKELTIFGFVTSEVGTTRFLKYNPAPGRYDGCTTERPW
jgi:hypothetical protein